MKTTKYSAPETEVVDIVSMETLCQSPTAFGGSTSDYGQENEDIF